MRYYFVIFSYCLSKFFNSYLVCVHMHVYAVCVLCMYKWTLFAKKQTNPSEREMRRSRAWKQTVFGSIAGILQIILQHTFRGHTSKYNACLYVPLFLQNTQRERKKERGNESKQNTWKTSNINAVEWKILLA